MKKIITLILILIMAVTLCSCGKKDENVFRMGIDPEYPPFSYVDDNGEYAGFDVDVCKAACESLGWKFEVFEVSWDDKLIQLDAKECDCIWSGMTIVDSMKEAGYVISDPYFDNSQVLVVKNDSGIETSADLAGKVVCVMLGTSGDLNLSESEDLAELVASFGDIVRCDSFLKCFTELAGNAVDAVYVDYPVAAGYLADKEGYTIISEDALGTELYGIAFRSGDGEKCDAIEKAVQTLVDNGTYRQIAEQYLDPSSINSLLLLK